MSRKLDGEAGDHFFRHSYWRTTLPYDNPHQFVVIERQIRKESDTYYHFALLKRGCKIPLERWRPWRYGRKMR